MSSRVYLPDNTKLAAPVVWRQVESGQKKIKAEGPAPASDFTAQIAQLQREAEARVREAHAAGVREGEAAGRSRAAAEIQPVMERLARTIDELSGLRGRLRAEAEADLIQLSLAIARRVLRRELAIDPDALHGLVLAALEKLQAQEICRVKVHPSHAAAISGYLSKTLTGATVDVIPDPAREPGSVIFETARGNLDASVESQLQEIERGLADRLRRHA